MFADKKAFQECRQLRGHDGEMMDTIKAEKQKRRQKKGCVLFWGERRMLSITRLLSLLAACIAAGGVEDFQCPGRRADGALVSHLSH